MASGGGGGDKGGGKTLNIKKEIALNSHLNTVVLYCKRGWCRWGRGTEGQYHDNGEERIRLLQLPYFFLGRTPLPPSPAKQQQQQPRYVSDTVPVFEAHSAKRGRSSQNKPAKMQTHTHKNSSKTKTKPSSITKVKAKQNTCTSSSN